MKRRTRAILFADVKDSTGLLASDEAHGTGRLSATMTKMRAQLERQGGQLFHSAGDGVAYFFDNVPAAVRAALSMSRALSQLDLPVRVGIHSGEVARLGDTFFGLAVNVAARVQAEAEPGKILLTGEAAAKLAGSAEFATTAPRKVQLKGLGAEIELVEVQAVATHSEAALDVPVASGRQRVQSRVAVLPFVAQSDEARWKYFADGFTEDLTANLSRFRFLSVISSHSAFHVAHDRLSDREAARVLRADFLITGRMQVFGERVRIIACIIDTESDVQLWSEKFDSQASDLFDILDKVSNQLAAKLAAKLEETSRLRIRSYHPKSLESYELLLRGFELYYLHTKSANGRARALFRKAVNIDKGMARGYAALSKTYNLEWRYRWSANPQRSLDLALELARLAVDVDKSEARGHSELGFAHLYRHELDQSLRSYEKALDLNPNDADVIAEYADSIAYSGNPQATIDLVETAKRLNPIYPDWYLWVQGGAYHQMHEYKAAIGTLTEMKDPSEASRLLASCYIRTGEKSLAERCVETVRSKHPNFKLVDWAGTQPFRNPADLAHLIDGMRMAGLS